MNNTKQSSVKKNYIYNLAFQLFALITPLITTPYVARVLSSVGNGQYTFVASINSYFCMAAALGFSFYAQREIAKRQGNKKEQSIVFWEILICKVVVGVLSFSICWLLIFLDVFGEYTFLMEIMSLEIISTTFNIAFFFQGNERFGLIAIRDFIIRIIGITLIFCFVKQQSDLWIYAICNVGTSILSAASLWACIRKDVTTIKIHKLSPLRHVKPSIKLFIPTIAISIYTILDKTLIGVLIPGTVENILPDGTTVINRIADIENGYYGQSEKIIKMAMTVLASLGTVMMPRNAKVLAEGDEKAFQRNISKAIEFIFFIGAPISAGLIAISNNFSPWFFGEGYEKVPVLMIIFSFMILPAGLGNVLGQQYLIPKGEDNKYIIVYVTSAIINLGLNMVLIPSFLSYGAAIASVIAESFAPLIMLSFLRKKVSIASIVKNNWKPMVSAVIMLIVVYFTSVFLKPSIINTVLLIILGIVIYICTTLIMKCQITYDTIGIVRKRFKR